MENYTYQNILISKKQLKQLLAWCFTKYGSITACFLADELKDLGFKYATQAGISISIEDLHIPEIKNKILNNANQEILNTEKIYLKGKITEVERYQKIIDKWNITSELLKDEVVSYFKKYDPLNSVFMMAFSGARGNLSQVRQLVGMRGLMSDPSGQIMNLPIKKNFREGLSITDYLMSGYGARKGIVDTALKTANSGYLTRRLIDVAQDIIIREKNCLTTHSYLYSINKNTSYDLFTKIIGRILNKPLYMSKTNMLLAEINTQITPSLLKMISQFDIENIYIRSPLTCRLYRSICQTCYGWDLATENLIDMGEAVGIIAGQSIGEPGTQLTMRTFHTGGIFTSETDQQLISSINGIINFSKLLKTSVLRTNRGENVLLTENSGSLSIIPINKDNKIVQIELPKNTILFIFDNQYVKKNTILGQLAGSSKQVRNETKQIINDSSGEVFMPRIKSKTTSNTNNKLLWILSGKVYQAPINSFLNFYLDSKINNNSFIFRGKISNQQYKSINTIRIRNKDIHQSFETSYYSFLLKKSKVQTLCFFESKINYLLIIDKLNYLIITESSNLKLQINKLQTKNLGKLISKSFLTLTGGIPYYANKTQLKKSVYLKNSISYLYHIEKKYPRTLIWLSEENYEITDDNSLLIVQNKTIIDKNSEIIPNLFSKTAGILFIEEKQNMIQGISIKSGIIYKIIHLNDLKNVNNKVFFPGETILNEITINQISLCQVFKINSYYQLLIRSIKLYEIPFSQSFKISINKFHQINKFISLKNNIKYLYNSGKTIKKASQLEIVSVYLNLHLKNYFEKENEIQVEIIPNHRKNCLNFSLSDKFSLNQYIPADLKYVKIQPCLIVESNQFVHPYTILGFLEVFTKQSLEIVKLKSKRKQNKQLFLISNEDCLIIHKNKMPNKILKNFIFENISLNKMGKILIKNNSLVTIQKGRPYFFPNCKSSVSDTNDLTYKLIESKFDYSNLFYKKYIHINYFHIIHKLSNFLPFPNFYEKLSFPKLLMKKRGKYYSSGIPILVREFLINEKNTNSTILSKLDKTPWYGYLDYKDKIYKTKRRDILKFVNRVRIENIFLLFMRNSELITNNLKTNFTSKLELAGVGLLEHPFRNLGIHSITEDYFEKEVNNVFCKNGEFLKSGETIGFLNFEKEITGDIVQGLPRIEELLEARKKKRISKHTPKSLKKSLLIRKTTIDSSFEFRKVGTTIKENEKINPHNLLKIYFNYFAKIKLLTDDSSKKIKLCELSDNYEASYKSFKKVQSLILNSVQSVYQSQGVTIANKHLEVIIKQMTTKVLITHEGNTPLLPREVIDLYHINYINEIIKTQNKFPAFYVPLLLGITKAALNNPSFISAASFQETTKVLTKAAVEGRLDWLRGLKETIIIGHLIPSGTGYKNYVLSFQKNIDKYLSLKFKIKN